MNATLDVRTAHESCDGCERLVDQAVGIISHTGAAGGSCIQEGTDHGATVRVLTPDPKEKGEGRYFIQRNSESESK